MHWRSYRAISLWSANGGIKAMFEGLNADAGS
jgi:hypothetical protein